MKPSPGTGLSALFFYGFSPQRAFDQSGGALPLSDTADKAWHVYDGFDPSETVCGTPVCHFMR